MLDVRNGDVLVLGGAEYPIKSCEAWPWPAGTRPPVPFLAATVSTKRSPGIAGGMQGPRLAHAAALGGQFTHGRQRGRRTGNR